MESQTQKTELIREILALTKANPEKYFDKLTDHKESFLELLAAICKKLK